MEHISLYNDALKAIREYKWLESEKAGHDLGIDAEKQWVERHWIQFYRLRLVQHLRGATFFEEFSRESFGRVHQRLDHGGEVLEAILVRVQNGAENLDLICWAQKNQLPRNEVLNILTALDINRNRLPPPIEAPSS